MEELSGRNSKPAFRSAQIFREIIRTGSTRRAGRELGITQSAVSQYLKLFEDAVGEKLFTRDRRGLIPTTQAIEIYNRLDRYFETLGRIEKEITNSLRKKENRLTIAAPHILSFGLVPKIVLAVDNLDPSLEFHFKAQRYDQIAQSVVTGEADIGISRLPLDERFFEWHIVAESKSVCVLHPDHRLADKDIITVDDIAHEPLILLEAEYASNKMGNLTFGRGEFPAKPKIYSDTIGLDASFIAYGIGITVDNEFISKHYQMFDLRIIPFEPAATYHYVVFWRRGSEKFSRHSAIVEAFIEVIRRDQSSRERRPGYKTEMLEAGAR
ncbi:MAG: LysR family transcriptional regulator [Mesorhizobium sp.]|uniref:LysR family transcriptional regulator n=1 Tax=unclassified Mesorhizobium TaxID=325217 RepID=UPI000F75C667|nr:MULTISPECIES: LysR family transcriptional regulator [unclassified Mesorhizobium]RVC80046.1 LysR family transcriptional regulator [Mesorhizobium sp. M2A.F.Ca.ET.046.02.1.1]AZO34168.1 LysR family transcriptional regulator [Mesorhizobium sp. M2A.F.Ca.ET.046.03.2.1]AZO71597.1 LysR family transcriptional regulator [Mesorhizobium sp. M1D.F.Ca.ET.043.01.1.1]RWB49825.1 MAG: LysR family transcriptional regulator [Mesorhizobium sp.]RWD00876.1 MAG: LysR family transcriptional regulator [Mesorhizobium 